MNNSLSNIFEILLSLERYNQNCQVVLATAGTDGLISNLPYHTAVISMNTIMHCTKHINKYPIISFSTSI